MCTSFLSISHILFVLVAYAVCSLLVRSCWLSQIFYFTLSPRGELYCDSTGCCDEEEEGLGVRIGLGMVEGGDF